MRTVAIGAAVGLIAAMGAAVAQDKPLLGIVSITATEANNARYIKGAKKAAAEKLAGKSRSIDAAGQRPTRPMPAIQNFVQRGAEAIVDMVFPVSSIGAGLAAADAAKIPVGTWGGGLGGSVIATNGSGGPMAVPIIEMMVDDLGGKGEVLALTYRTGEVCRNREVVMDEILAKLSRHQGHQERGPHPRLFRGRRAIRHRLARAPSRRQRPARRSGAAGTIRRSAPSRRCARPAATTSRSMASTATPRRSRTSRRAS